MKEERQRREKRGRDAEETAARYLESIGFRILERRLRTPAGEVDLVASGGDVLVFAEVKARRSIGRGLFALTDRQATRIASAAECFLSGKVEYTNVMIRFDLVVVTPGNPPVHFPNAWQCDG